MKNDATHARLAGPRGLAGKALAGMASLSSRGHPEQSSNISPLSSLSSYWQVATTPTPHFNIPMAFGGALLANPHFTAYLSLWNPAESSCEGKPPHKLSSETMVTQSLGATTKTLSCKPY